MDPATEAYRAGDLENLIDLMTEAQQFDFKYAMVRQAVHFTEMQLPPKEEDDGERSAIGMAQRWLDDPTPQNAHDALMFIVAEYMDGGLRYSDYGRVFAEPAEAVTCEPGTSSMTRAAGHARNTAIPGQDEAALGWQLDVALAILQDRPIPPLAPPPNP
jgi:hypothetical protein